MEVTRLLVDCYFDIVRKNLQDAVPKAIMHFLVLFVQRGLQQRLIRCLYRSATTLLSEISRMHSFQRGEHKLCKNSLLIDTCHQFVIVTLVQLRTSRHLDLAGE